MVVDVTVRSAFWLLPVLPVVRYRCRLSVSRSATGSAEPG